MARNHDRERGPRTVKDNRPPSQHQVCAFCADPALVVDYKDISRLRRMMSDRGKIKARRATGLCAQHQRDVQVAVKTARELALLPYAQRTVSERNAGRGQRSGLRRPVDGARATEPDGASATVSVPEPEEVDA